MGKKDKNKKYGKREIDKSDGVKRIGENCRLLGDIDKHNRDWVEIGHDVVLGGESQIILHGPIRPYRLNHRVVIDDYVWIGRRCIILPGVHIGKASIIGAMSLVCGDIEPYSVAVGSPCQRIRQITPLELLRTRVIKKDRKLLGDQNWSWDSLTMDDIKDLFGYKTDVCFDNIDLDNIKTVRDVLAYYDIKEKT